MATRSLQAELQAFFLKAKVPSSPALAAKILEAADDPTATVDDFAELIHMDPALSARLLSMTNSAACAQRSPVVTIQRAVALLGINRVRTVSLGFQLVSHIDRLGGCPFDMKMFWQQSLLRGCLARAFAETIIPACAEEAFLVGLLQDCGCVLLVQLLGKPYADLCQARLSPSAFYEAEQRQFPFDHVQAITVLARDWHLPEAIVGPISHQHTEAQISEFPTDSEKLSLISYLVGSVRLSNASTVHDCEPSIAGLAVGLGLNDEVLAACFQHAAESYRETAQLLSGIVPEDLDVTDLLSEANAHLTATVESERDEAAKERARLASALGEYRDRAAHDPLTGLLNRGALTDALQDALDESAVQEKTISIFFLDIDDFKSLNDTFGHQTGDQVLREVACCLRDTVTNAGIVGRYGGEEFLLAVVGLTESAAEQLAADLVDSVRRRIIPEISHDRSITCSVGALWGIPTMDASTDQMVHAADELMYQAKRQGKDRWCFRSLGPQDQILLPQEKLEAVNAYAGYLRKVSLEDVDHFVVPEKFQRIANKLNETNPKRFMNIRKQDRKDLVIPCRLTLLAPGTLQLVSENAFVRNISTGGIGLLSSRRIRRGHAVEVALLVDGEPRLYVAGIVAFCRHVEDVVHEMGLQLFTHSKSPILSQDPASAIRNLDWVAAALESLKTESPTPC